MNIDFNTIQKEHNKLDLAIKKMADHGKKYVELKHDYQVALGQEMLILKNEGKSVTLIPNLAKANKNVAKLRMERDIEEVMYKTSMEYINTQKIYIKNLQEQYNKEWSNVSNS